MLTRPWWHAISQRPISAAGLRTADVCWGYRLAASAGAASTLPCSFNHIVSSHEAFASTRRRWRHSGTAIDPGWVYSKLDASSRGHRPSLLGSASMKTMRGWNSGNAPVGALNSTWACYSSGETRVPDGAACWVVQRKCSTLYDTVDVRERVAADIATAHAPLARVIWSRAGAGGRVPFRCPEYEELRARLDRSPSPRKPSPISRAKLKSLSGSRAVTAGDVAHAADTTEEQLKQHEIKEKARPERRMIRRPPAEQERALATRCRGADHRARKSSSMRNRRWRRTGHGIRCRKRSCRPA